MQESWRGTLPMQAFESERQARRRALDAGELGERNESSNERRRNERRGSKGRGDGRGRNREGRARGRSAACRAVQPGMREDEARRGAGRRALATALDVATLARI